MTIEHLRQAALAALLLLPATARADEPSMSNTIETPGAVDPTATWTVVCNGTTKTRRHVSAAMKAEVLAAYNIPAAQSAYYEIDHLIPLAIGGANAIANLWPQPWAEADQKDVLEVELQRRVCRGLLAQAQAQREIADDWTTAYERYVGGRLIVAPDPGDVAATAPPAPFSFKARMKAERYAWRAADPRRQMIASLLLTMLIAGADPADRPGHSDAIKMFAATMAIAKTVRDNCPTVDANDRFLESLRQHLRINDDDHAAFAPQAREAADTLKRALDGAPSRQAWCDAVFDLYGPSGRLMSGLLERR